MDAVMTRAFDRWIPYVLLFCIYVLYILFCAICERLGLALNTLLLLTSSTQVVVRIVGPSVPESRRAPIHLRSTSAWQPGT